MHSLAFAVTHVRFPDGRIDEIEPKTFLTYETNLSTSEQNKILIRPDVPISDIAGKKNVFVKIPAYFMLLQDYIVPYKNHNVPIIFIEVRKEHYSIKPGGIYKLLSDIIVKKGVCNDRIPVSFVRDFFHDEYYPAWDDKGWPSMFIRSGDKIVSYPDPRQRTIYIRDIPKLALFSYAK